MLSKTNLSHCESSSSDSGYKSRQNVRDKLVHRGSCDSLPSSPSDSFTNGKHRSTNNNNNASINSSSTNTNNTNSNSNNGTTSTRLSSTKAGYSWRDDDSCLYSDIEACDTLFLDIGAKEPPELLAARNLKGKIKKKKVVKQKSKSVEVVSPRDTGDETFSKLLKDADVAVSLEVADGDQLQQQTVKVKKKIKIVIGKRTKPKVLRKK